MQEEEFGDGTTTVVVLVGELLKQAEQQDNLEENQLAENENGHVDQEQDMGDGTGYDDEKF